MVTSKCMHARVMPRSDMLFQSNSSQLGCSACRLDAVTWAAGHHNINTLLQLQHEFPTLQLQECAHPFASAASCNLAAAEEKRHMYYEDKADIIGHTIKVLITWLQRQQPDRAARSTCLDRHDEAGVSALACLVCNYNPG